MLEGVFLTVGSNIEAAQKIIRENPSSLNPRTPGSNLEAADDFLSQAWKNYLTSEQFDSLESFLVFETREHNTVPKFLISKNHLEDMLSKHPNIRRFSIYSKTKSFGMFAI